MNLGEYNYFTSLPANRGNIATDDKNKLAVGTMTYTYLVNLRVPETALFSAIEQFEILNICKMTMTNILGFKPGVLE